jgi:hypothetical protein
MEAKAMRKFVMIFCLMAASADAQWPAQLPPSTPRTPAGKPDLSAPAPRTADGKPDLSGVWVIKNYGGGLFYLTSDLKPEEMLPWAAALYRQRQNDFRRDTDGIHCLPPGPKAGIAVGNFPMKIIQTPDLVAVLYEYQTIYRQFFLDGRSLPEGANPTWMGYSVARWEGDTLAVTTAGYNDRSTLDLAGHPHTEALRMTERYYRRDFGHIDLRVTFEDPTAYTRSWTLPLELNLLPDQQLIEYVCENERDSVHLVGKSGAEAQVSVDILAKYAGTYEAPGFPAVRVFSDGNRFTIDTGVGKVPLIAHSENYFTMEGTGVEFVRDSNGAITGMVEHWTEGDRKYERKK